MDEFYPALELSWPVHVMVPGEAEPQTFTARLALHVCEREPSTEEWREIIRATLVGWADVVNEAGEPVAYSEEAKARLLGYGFIFSAVAEAVELAARSTRVRAAALNRALAAEPQPEIN